MLDLYISYENTDKDLEKRRVLINRIISRL